MEKDATYTSVWDGGYEVTTKCKVDTVTKEVLDIEPSGVDSVEVLEDEYVTVDGKRHSVSEYGGDAEFWRA